MAMKYINEREFIVTVKPALVTTSIKLQSNLS